LLSSSSPLKQRRWFETSLLCCFGMHVYACTPRMQCQGMCAKQDNVRARVGGNLWPGSGWSSCVDALAPGRWCSSESSHCLAAKISWSGGHFASSHASSRAQARGGACLVLRRLCNHTRPISGSLVLADCFATHPLDAPPLLTPDISRPPYRTGTPPGRTFGRGSSSSSGSRRREWRP
jgi:hypothetical protein